MQFQPSSSLPEDPGRAVVVHLDDVAEEAWPGIVTWRTLLGGEATPTDGLTVGVAEIPVGGSTEGADHRHDPPEAYVVLAGTGIVHLDGAVHPVRAGSAVAVPGGAWHHVENTGEEPLRLVFVFPVRRFADVVYEHRDDPPPTT